MRWELFLTSFVALGLSVPAFAADLPPRPVKAPVVATPVYDWTGFYIGANGGWGESRNCWGFETGAGVVSDGCSTKSGGVFGGQAGYRWQMGQFVFGVEGQGDWASMKASQVSSINPAQRPPRSIHLGCSQDNWDGPGIRLLFT